MPGTFRDSLLGYKNHVGIDRAHGFIRRFVVTHAARHDGSQLGALIDADNTASRLNSSVNDRRVVVLVVIDPPRP